MRRTFKTYVVMCIGILAVCGNIAMAGPGLVIYRDQGGKRMTASSGTTFRLLSGSTLDIQAGATVVDAGTSTRSTDLTLDDGAGDSPQIIFIDGSDETLTITKTDGSHATFIIGATSAIQVVTGNLRIGDGTPDVTQDGEDGYVEGTFEVDGATTLDNTVSIDGRATTTDGVVGGTARVIGGRAFSQLVASSAISATTAEIDFDQSYSIPADTLKAGSEIRIRTQGIATATNSSDTLTIIVYLGSTALVTTAAVDVADNDVWFADILVSVRTAGGSGTFVAMSHYQDPDAAGTGTKWTNSASTVIDTTGTNTVKVSATWSSTSASNSCRQDVLVVDIL